MGTSHIVRKYSLRAGKPFYPNGSKCPLRDFQDAYRGQEGKIGVSQKIIRDYGLCSRVYLGRPLLFYAENIAGYLYDNTIHPRFFAEALHVIASNAMDLGPILKHVQLLNLGRNNIDRALGAADITENDIGKHFQLFSKKTVQERLDILRKLGVLVLEQGSSLPEVSCPNPNTTTHLKGIGPRPPIKKVDPAKITARRETSPAHRQLSFLGLEKTHPEKG